MDVNLEAVMGNQLWMVTLNGGFHGTSTWNGGFSITDGWSGRKKKLTTSLRLEWWLNGFCANSPLKWPKEKKQQALYGLTLMQASELWWFTQIHVDWCWLFWSHDICWYTVDGRTPAPVDCEFFHVFPCFSPWLIGFQHVSTILSVVDRISQPSAVCWGQALAGRAAEGGTEVAEDATGPGFRGDSEGGSPRVTHPIVSGS